MTDDFQLFDQSSDDPVDPDIALITAYLARELSPVQIVAVEDRLANDTAFLRKVEPILEAWVMPTPLSAVHAGQGPLSRDEVEGGWARYVGEHAELDAHEGPRLVVEGAQRKRRKISMTRIAAGVAAITLPMFALAQVVVYVAKHPGAPGHGAAKTIVAPFAVAPPPPPEPVVLPEITQPRPEDVRVGRELKQPATQVQRAPTVVVPAVESLKVAVVAQPAPPPVTVAIPNPDREKIAALIKAHMPQVVRGDTAADFAVIVLSADDKYVWSTFGSGAVQIVVGADKRTPGERAVHNRQNSAEYMGPALRVGAGGGRGGGGGGGAGAGLAGTISRDTARIIAAPIPRAASDSNLRIRLDSIVGTVRRMDTMRVAAGGARGGGGGGGGGGAVGGFAASPTIAGLDSGSYVLGVAARIATGGVPVPTNAAAGLQDPGRGESGIQGLKAKSLIFGETYQFQRGQLDAQSRALRVLVVHMAPGTNWP